MKKSILPYMALGSLLAGTMPAEPTGQEPVSAAAASSIGLELAIPYSLSVGNKFDARGQQFRDVDIAATSIALVQTVPMDRFALQFGFEASFYQIKAGKNGVVPIPEKLRSVGVPIAVTISPPGAWTWTVSAMPGSSFAGTSLQSKGFGVSAVALGSRRHSETFSYSLGLAYDSLASSTYKLFPVAGLEWTPTERWSMALGIPRTGLTYQASEALSLALELSGNAGTFYVRDDPLPGRSFKPDLSNSKLEYVEGRIELSAKYWLGPQVAFSVSGGLVLVSEFEYLKRDYRLESKGTAPFLSINATVGF